MCVYACVYVYVDVCVLMYVCLCVCVCVCVCVSVHFAGCLYIYMPNLRTQHLQAYLLSRTNTRETVCICGRMIIRVPLW